CPTTGLPRTPRDQPKVVRSCVVRRPRAPHNWAAVMAMEFLVRNASPLGSRNVTEIPEHLLKRSKERRAALGLPTDGGDAPAATPAAATPAASSPETPAAAAPPAKPAAPATPAAPPPPKPDPPYVAAAKRRRRIPFWAM